MRANGARSAGWGAIVNNFCHDLATGTWLGLLFVLIRLQTASAATVALSSLVRPILREGFHWGLVLAAIVMLTGGIRSWTYGEGGVAPGVRATKVRLLWAKHVLLLFGFVVGTWYEFIMAFR